MWQTRLRDILENFRQKWIFDECTLLAGIPNAPTNYNPLASPELARQRQAQVIEKMKEAGYLEEDAAEE